MEKGVQDPSAVLGASRRLNAPVPEAWLWSRPRTPGEADFSSLASETWRSPAGRVLAGRDPAPAFTGPRLGWLGSQPLSQDLQGRAGAAWRAVVTGGEGAAQPACNPGPKLLSQACMRQAKCSGRSGMDSGNGD